MRKSPYTEYIVKKCNICKHDVLVNQLGQGACNHCGWRQGQDDGMHPDKIIYPNLISFNKAIQLYRQGKLLLPTLEEFVEGLFFYSEMEFHYKGHRYGVVFGKGHSINFYEFNQEYGYQIYNTKEEFIDEAHINGKLLKDIWSDVENAGYMSCM